MLSSFDWVRLSRTGAELLATLEFVKTRPDIFPSAEEDVGPPFSALDSPCQRCWVYAPLPGRRYCRACQSVLARAAHLSRRSYAAVVVWGFVNQLPRQLWASEGFYREHTWGDYVRDEHHFLLVMHRRQLKPWLQELALYHGSDLKGIIQVLPTSGTKFESAMGNILCLAAYQEARFSMDRLHVRFFSAPHQLLHPHTRDRAGLLTFDVPDFLSLLETAAVFRSLLRPEEQKSLYELLKLEDPGEEQFYWGRFTASLNQDTRDMLSAWRVRQWPKSRVKLLYELVDYVGLYQTD